MDLARSWLAAIAVYLVVATATAGTAVRAGAEDDDFSGDGALLWNALPMLAAFFLMVVLAAAAHPASERDRRTRNAIAIFSIPCLAVVAQLLVGIAQGQAGATAMGTVGALAGAAAGWGFLVLIRRRRRTP
ncbi:hypothetical protein [Actinomadura sp. 9N407]|uniref:hypothetical protein n=1 Tax=Actinomadura sp. 9N407 TaxID=3375154 RepID=UPI0037AC59BB